MPSQRQSSGKQTETYFGPQPSPSPVRPVKSAPAGPRRIAQSPNRPVRDYGPTEVGERAGSATGALEAEFFATIFLLVVTLFTDQTSSYGDKMISVMKRGTLTVVAFFLLALFASAGPNAARFSKAFGFLIVMAVLLTTAGVDTINSLDTFFKANWPATGGNSSTAAANQTSSSAAGSAAAQAQSAAANSANTITDINLPGIGPVFAFKDAADALRKLFHL